MKIQIRYIPFLVFAMLALLLGLWAGLVRIGWSFPTFSNLALLHGPLMVSGFLGVLIPLERAVAIRQKWMFLAPLLSGIGWISLLISPKLGIMLLTLGSLGALGILIVMVHREPQVHTIIMALGALSWCIGNILWLSGFPIFQMIFWWMCFLILTIGGERLELSRVLQPTKKQIRIFVLFVTLLLLGAILATFNLHWGARLSGLSMLALSIWFLSNDLAKHNIHHPNPLTRYIAICLFGGFIWLGIGGLLQLIIGATYAGPLYDATLHIVFVGFVITMIFGHAPIIFPAILQVPINFYPAFYAHLIILHLSLTLRVYGDLTNQITIRQWGGLFNEIAILMFIASTIFSIIKGKNKHA